MISTVNSPANKQQLISSLQRLSISKVQVWDDVEVKDLKDVEKAIRSLSTGTGELSLIVVKHR